MRHFHFVAALWIIVGASGAQAAMNCEEIRFAPGASSAEVVGEAPSDDVLCYTISTAAGQDANLQVLDGSNTIVTVLGVPEAEARQDISFKTREGEYEIRVGQLLRAIEPQPFRLLIRVE